MHHSGSQAGTWDASNEDTTHQGLQECPLPMAVYDERGSSSMKLIRVGAAVLNQTPLDWDGNRARISGAITAAREAGVSILCLPELCITGYGCEDAFHAPGTQQMALDVLAELLPQTRGMIISLGLPLLFHGSLFNTACVVSDRQILGFV